MHGLIEIIAMNKEAQRFWEDGIQQPPTMLLKRIDFGSERIRQAYGKMQRITVCSEKEEI